jgi:2-hydroxychromene-2-carboxylate isomerase
MAKRPVSAPRLYFNLRSPYSWLTLHDLTTSRPDFLETLELRPFWEPSPEMGALLQSTGGRFIYTPMSREKHFYVLYDVRRLAGERGLQVTWPVDRSPRWEVAHLAYLAAVRSGTGSEFAIAASRARWERGQDISDPAVVAGIGAALGLDATELTRLAGEPAMAAAGAKALADAYLDGVFGVPFFVHGREKFWGIDRLGAFIKSVRSAEAEEAAPEPASGASSVAMAVTDDGHAGGCG